MGFKKVLKTTAKFLKRPFKRSNKTWINAGLTLDVLVPNNGDGFDGSQRGVSHGVSLALKRIECGACPFCGIPTHRRTFFGSMRAITVGGSVMNGHCLRCFPIAAFSKIKKPDTPTTANAVTEILDQQLDEADMLLDIDRDKLSHVSDLSGSFYCDIKHLS